MKFNSLNDFEIISNNNEWYPLTIRKYVSQFEREIGFLKEFNKKILNIGNFGDKYIYLNIPELLCDLTDIEYNEYINTILRLEPNVEIKILNIGYIISDDLGELYNYTRYKFGQRFLYVNDNNKDYFNNLYNRYIINDEFKWNNLINILFMVKNAGDNFENILLKNIPYMDRFTILDTGSTDNTVEIAKRVLKDIRGDIYQEEFINFRDSRNRLLELASNHCTFNIMLDDTYILNGNLIEFLDLVRGDDFADSYSLYVKNFDLTYSTNRIFKSNRNIYYMYTMHEIPIANKNVQIDEKYGYIIDETNDYMINRTTSRKEYDLKCLFQDLETYNNNPRTYYYIAETYLNLGNNDNKFYNEAYNFYKKRSEINTGYNEEIQDSLYKMGVLGLYNLNYEWKDCLQLFLKCYDYDNSRPESLIIIGKYYYDNKKYNLAMLFLEKAYKIGLPKNLNMNIKTLLFYYYLPKMLLDCCLELKEYKFGLEILDSLNISFNKLIINLKLSYYNVFLLLSRSYNYLLEYNSSKKIFKNNFTISIVAEGGWNNWDGKSLEKDGLGGSEKWVIKYSEYMAKKLNNTNIIVFCKCTNQSFYNNVYYIPISEYYKFIVEYNIDICFVSRYVYYLNLSLEYINNVYLVNHDLLLDTDIINDHKNLKGVLGISEWHVKYLKDKLPHLSYKIDLISYGIEINDYNPIVKRNFSFIYSSFANRGLLTLLQLYPYIKQRYPETTLDIFCDINHKFVQENCKEEMDYIQLLLENYKYLGGITVHGWVNTEKLNSYWNSSHVWFYPTHFKETCCHTAYEAAASKTLVITTPLAGLEYSAKNGILIEGDPLKDEWKNKALEKLYDILDNPYKQEEFINKNYEWILNNKTYEKVVDDFIIKYIVIHMKK